MRIERLSPKQREVFRFVGSGDRFLICDGAVRTGKTTMLAAAMVIWAMERFDRTAFAICGRTVQSAERNVVRPLMELEQLPYDMSFHRSRRTLTVRCGRRENYFYLFGGKDESSYTLIQGATLAGALLDEAALMPRSFVEQTLSRAISYEAPKFFFSCNPQAPSHYFYREWIARKKPGTQYLHFTLEDNPILTPEMIRRTQAMYSGVFYDRYIRGLWVAAQGLVYPMFGPGCVAPAEERDYERWVISMDYGIQNPTAMGLWGLCRGVWYQVDEYYHSGRETGSQQTDQQYYQKLEALAGDRPVERVIVDPSAASFLALVRQRGRFRVRGARNDVLDGIRRTAQCLQAGRLMVGENCRRTLEEYGLYRWDDRGGQDRPVKEHDHAMDMTRYFVSTMEIWKQPRTYRPLWAMDEVRD